MKKALVILTVTASFLSVSCGEKKGDAPKEAPKELEKRDVEATSNTEPSDSTGDYNEALALELRADNYGMGKYVIAFLKSGPNRPTDSTESANLQAAHMKNIGRLVEEGKLVLAGPFLDNGDLRGIYIFDVESVKEAEELTATDPAIQAGSLVMELHPWYGSAAVRQIPELHKRIQKVDF